MPDGKKVVADWLEPVASNILAERILPWGVEPLLVGYLRAARQSGFDLDLIDRLSLVLKHMDPHGTEAGMEIRTIAGEARRRYLDPFAGSQLEP